MADSPKEKDPQPIPPAEPPVAGGAEGASASASASSGAGSSAMSVNLRTSSDFKPADGMGSGVGGKVKGDGTDYLRDATGWDEMSRLERAKGERPKVEETRLEEWRKLCHGNNVVVVAGVYDGETAWVAQHLAECLGRHDVRLGRYMELPFSGGYEGIFRQLTGGDSRCLVMDCWSPIASGQLLFTLRRLEEAARYDDYSKCRLIVWTRRSALQEKLDLGLWPSNLPAITLDPSRREPSAEGGAPDLNEGFFQALFGYSAQNLSEVMQGRTRVIEQTLARLAVLFGTLPAGDTEELLLSALGDTQIPVGKPKEGAEEEEVPASRLWKTGKAYFLRAAGLVRRTQEVPVKIGFPSDEVAAMAARVAWEDPEAMIATFSSAEGMMILFGEDSTRQRRDLYEGYIQAAVLLARHVPRLYGARWLDLVRRSYEAWVKQRFPDLPLDGGSIFSLLAGLERQRAYGEQRKKAWNHFAQRAGYLCRFLMAESESIVEEFLEALHTQKVPGVLWPLLRVLKSAPYPRYFHWVKRLIHDVPDGAPEYLATLAEDALEHENQAQLLFGEFSRAFPADPRAPKNLVEQAAKAFPLVVLERAYLRHEAGESVPAGPLGLLGRPLQARDSGGAGGLPEEYIAKCLDGEYAGLVAVWPGASKLAGDDAGFRLGFPLYQACVLALGDPADPALPLVRAVKGRVGNTEWRRVARSFGSMADYLAERKRLLSFAPAKDAERRFLMERIDLCRRLMRL